MPWHEGGGLGRSSGLAPDRVSQVSECGLRCVCLPASQQSPPPRASVHTQGDSGALQGPTRCDPCGAFQLAFSVGPWAGCPPFQQTDRFPPEALRAQASSGSPGQCRSQSGQKARGGPGPRVSCSRCGPWPSHCPLCPLRASRRKYSRGSQEGRSGLTSKPRRLISPDDFQKPRGKPTSVPTSCPFHRGPCLAPGHGHITGWASASFLLPCCCFSGLSPRVGRTCALVGLQGEHKALETP